MDGVIIVNKPHGMSSSDVCVKVKKILKLKKVGHLGTLDPLATGVLPLCINEGTKLVPFLQKDSKEYTGVMQLGIVTDTQDSQGKIIRQSDDIPCDHEVIRDAFRQFYGEIFQTPPMYSALKHNGVPLYKIARRGGWVSRERRKIVIHDSEVISIDVPYIHFRVVCSHGTYIRTLCHDIGEVLGCGAHLTHLTRTRNGPFHIDRSIALNEVGTCAPEMLVNMHLISPRDALRGMPEAEVSEEVEQKIRNGIQPTVTDIGGMAVPALHRGQQFKAVSCRGGGLVGIVESLVDSNAREPRTAHAQAWKILRVFTG